MRVQILSGAWKGRALTVPNDLALRPTTQKVRAALFNILGARVAGARVLDLFAGTGALGFEALSRGASAVTFVERAPDCVAAIRRSLAVLAPPPAVRVEVLPIEAPAAVRQLARERRAFDLVFADPPYDGPWGKKILQVMGAHGIIGPAGWLVLEGPTGVAPPPGFQPMRQAHYGDTTLTFYDHSGLSRHV